MSSQPLLPILSLETITPSQIQQIYTILITEPASSDLDDLLYRLVLPAQLASHLRREDYRSSSVESFARVLSKLIRNLNSILATEYIKWISKSIIDNDLNLTTLLYLQSQKLLVKIMEARYNFKSTGHINEFLERYRERNYTRQCNTYGLHPDVCMLGAIKYGHQDVLDLALERGATSLYEGAKHAARYNRIDMLKQMISLGKLDPNRVAIGAARGGHVNLVRELTNGLITSENRGWIIEGAATSGCLVLVEELMGTITRTRYKRCLDIAATRGHLHIVKCLNNGTSKWRLAVGNAAYEGHIEIVDELLHQNNAKCALTRAVRGLKPAVVQLILEKYGNQLGNERKLEFNLAFAITNHNVEIFELLFQSKFVTSDIIRSLLRDIVRRNSRYFFDRLYFDPRFVKVNLLEIFKEAVHPDVQRYFFNILFYHPEFKTNYLEILKTALIMKNSQLFHFIYESGWCAEEDDLKIFMWTAEFGHKEIFFMLVPKFATNIKLLGDALEMNAKHPRRKIIARLIELLRTLSKTTWDVDSMIYTSYRKLLETQGCRSTAKNLDLIKFYFANARTGGGKLLMISSTMFCQRMIHEKTKIWLKHILANCAVDADTIIFMIKGLIERNKMKELAVLYIRYMFEQLNLVGPMPQVLKRVSINVINSDTIEQTLEFEFGEMDRIAYRELESAMLKER